MTHDPTLIARLTAALERALAEADRWSQTDYDPGCSQAPDLDAERALLASLQAPRRVMVGPGHVRSGRRGVITATVDTDHGPLCAVHLERTDHEDERLTYVPEQLLVEDGETVPTRTVETTEVTHARVRAAAVDEP